MLLMGFAVASWFSDRLLACFDISDDKQRRFISRRLEHFGIRVQYSVFEIRIKHKQELVKLQIP